MKTSEFIGRLEEREQILKIHEEKQKAFFKTFFNNFEKLKVTSLYVVIGSGDINQSYNVFVTNDNRWMQIGFQKMASCAILNNEKIYEDYKGIKTFMDSQAPEWVIVIEIENKKIKIITNIASKVELLGAIMG